MKARTTCMRSSLAAPKPESPHSAAPHKSPLPPGEGWVRALHKPQPRAGTTALTPALSRGERGSPVRVDRVGAVQALRPVLLRLTGLRREGSALLNLLDSGPDLLLRTDAQLSAADRTLLARFAEAHGMPRVSWAGKGQSEPAAQLRPATH